MSLVLPIQPAKSKQRKPRNWSLYNEKLVQRGEISFYLESLETWTEDLCMLNFGKTGHKYKFPHSLFFVAFILRLTYQIPYRALEGLLRTLGCFLGFSAPNYSTIQKRCKEINLLDWLPQKPLKNDLILSVDASGIKIDNYSDWMRHKWQDKAKKRRGWVKMHIIVDTETHVAIDVHITTENVGDQDEFIPLVQSALDQELNVKRVLGDGIFDTREIHNFLGQQKILPGIPPRKNATTQSRGSSYRAAEVRFYKDYGEDIWKLFHDYNQRPAVERTFSVFKQLFGDGVMARKWENIEHELLNKFWLMNWNLSRPVLSRNFNKNLEVLIN